MKIRPLFVYGTLRRARGRQSPLLRRARFIQRASMTGELYDLGAYPGAYRRTRNRTRIFGELYALPDEDPWKVVSALDRYEGGAFARRQVLVTLADGSRRAAWAYVLRKRPNAGRVIPSGRYQARRGAA